jgi:hypothetical protein
MKDGGRQSSVCLSLLKNLYKVAGITCAAGRDDRNPDSNSHPGGQFAIKAITGAVAVN